MSSIQSRLAALTQTVKSWQERRVTAYEDLDPLSQAMVDYVNELESLATPGERANYAKSPA